MDDQALRLECLRLAVNLGTPSGEVVKVARDLEDYVKGVSPPDQR